jgi:Spy/CpxP family protein refolding chaperone
MNKILVALVFVLTSSLALAQTWGNQDSGAKGGHNPAHAERMQNELGLTDEQVKQMREIRDSGGTREEIQAVLTPEQRDKAAQLRKERRSDREARKTRMQQELGLTDEQQSKLAQIRKDGGSREDMRAVLTPEQQAKFDAMHGKREGKGPKPAWQTKPPAATPSAAKPAEASSAQPAASSGETPAKPASGTTPSGAN